MFFVELVQENTATAIAVAIFLAVVLGFCHKAFAPTEDELDDEKWALH
jgi:hypothetical protein